MYTATLNKVIDGTTIDMDVDIGDSQIEKKRIRIVGIQAYNIFKKFRTSFDGASGVFAMLEVSKWFYENGSDYKVFFDTIDICGRWLGDIKNQAETESLRDTMLSLYYKNIKWSVSEQEILKQEWFDGEVVTIPGGDVLPIFHNWGKSCLLGYNSLLYNSVF